MKETLSIGNLNLQDKIIIYDFKDEESIIDGESKDSQNIQIPPDFKSAVTVHRFKQNKDVSWADAVMHNSKVALMYDYQYLSVAFMEDREEKAKKPYRAVIGIESPDKLFPSRTFWYDTAGELTALRADTFDPDVLRTNFRRLQDGWQILYFADNNHYGDVIVASRGENFIKGFELGKIDLNHEVIVDEYNYLLGENDNTFSLTEGPLYNREHLKYEVPYKLDLEKYAKQLSGDNWLTVALDYPAKITININKPAD